MVERAILPDLVMALTFVRENLVGPDFDQDMRQEIKEDTERLSSLNDRLNALVQEHDSWQEIYNDLRMLEGNLNGLEWCWPRWKELTEPLCGASVEGWAASFKLKSDQLESAIATQDPLKLKTPFRLYSRQADIRFYVVDKDLKTACEELRTVGERLTAMLRMLG